MSDSSCCSSASTSCCWSSECPAPTNIAKSGTSHLSDRQLMDEIFSKLWQIQRDDVGGKEKPLSLEDLEDLLKKKKMEQKNLEENSPADSSTSFSPSRPGFRKWTDNTGKYHTNAKLISKNEKSIGLVNELGVEITVAIARLSNADHVFLRQVKKHSIAISP